MFPMYYELIYVKVVKTKMIRKNEERVHSRGRVAKK